MNFGVVKLRVARWMQMEEHKCVPLQSQSPADHVEATIMPRDNMNHRMNE